MNISGECWITSKNLWNLTLYQALLSCLFDLGVVALVPTNKTTMNAYIELAKLMLPEEISKSFSLVKVEEEKVEQDKRLHLYLEELNIPPDHVDVLKPNGFYPESLMGDFPIRDRQAVLHLRRRRRSEERRVGKECESR